MCVYNCEYINILYTSFWLEKRDFSSSLMALKSNYLLLWLCLVTFFMSFQHDERKYTRPKPKGYSHYGLPRVLDVHFFNALIFNEVPHGWEKEQIHLKQQHPNWKVLAVWVSWKYQPRVIFFEKGKALSVLSTKPGGWQNDDKGWIMVHLWFP